MTVLPFGLRIAPVGRVTPCAPLAVDPNGVQRTARPTNLPQHVTLRVVP